MKIKHLVTETINDPDFGESRVTGLSPTVQQEMDDAFFDDAFVREVLPIVSRLHNFDRRLEKAIERKTREIVGGWGGWKGNIFYGATFAPESWPQKTVNFTSPPFEDWNRPGQPEEVRDHWFDNHGDMSMYWHAYYSIEYSDSGVGHWIHNAVKLTVDTFRVELIISPPGQKRSLTKEIRALYADTPALKAEGFLISSRGLYRPFSFSVPELVEDFPVLDRSLHPLDDALASISNVNSIVDNFVRRVNDAGNLPRTADAL